MSLAPPPSGASIISPPITTLASTVRQLISAAVAVIVTFLPSGDVGVAQSLAIQASAVAVIVVDAVGHHFGHARRR